MPKPKKLLNPRQVQLDDSTLEELKRLGKMGDNYDDVVKMLIDAYKSLKT